MQKYWTKFRRIGLEWGGGERGGDNVATASTLFLPFPGQLDSRVASHRIVWHCGRFALFLLCSIEKFACQELCKAFAKRKRQSCREREREGRTDQGPRLQSGSKNNREKISFVSGKRFALFFRLDASFSASSFPHIGHTTNGKQKKKKEKQEEKNLIEHWNHRNHRRSFARLLFLLLFSIFIFDSCFVPVQGGEAGQESVCWIAPPSIILGGNWTTVP